MTGDNFLTPAVVDAPKTPGGGRREITCPVFFLVDTMKDGDSELRPAL